MPLFWDLDNSSFLLGLYEKWLHWRAKQDPWVALGVIPSFLAVHAKGESAAL